MAGPDRPYDAELDQLFREDPELRVLSERLRAARPEPALDPRFKAVLRARVMAAAERELRPRPVLLRKPWFLRGGSLAFGGGALGVAMITAAVVSLLVYRPQDATTSPTASSSASGVARLDPNSVIRVSFTKPMDRASVLRGLDIRPATTYTAAWSAGDTLLTLVPTHRLAANTAYTVTIGHALARDASGRAPQQDIQFTFGTAPTSVPVIPVTPAPAPAPVFSVSTLGPAAVGSRLDVAPDGSVVSGGAPFATPSSASAATPSAPTSATPTAVAGPTGSPTPSAAASPTAAPPSAALTRYPATGPPVRLGSGGGTVAASDDGRLIAALVPSGSGASVTVVDAAGGQPTSLGSADSSNGPLVWAAPDTIEYVGGGRLRSVNLQGSTRTLGPQTVATGQTVVLASRGHTAYLGPASGQSGGQLLDLGSLQTTPIPGASSQVVFSGDGTHLAWVDHPGGSDRVLVAPVSDPATTTTVATLHGADTVRGVALSLHGGRAAVAHSTGTLRAVELGSNTLLASTTLDLDGGLVWAPAGDRLAAVRHDPGGDSVVVAALPGTRTVEALPDSVPAAASGALDRFLKAQITPAGDLTALVSPSLDASRLHPAGLSRDYVIRDVLNADGTVSAEVRLVADPSGGAPIRSASESLTLSQSAGQWLVSSVSLGPLQVEPTGPQVVHVSSTSAGGQSTLQASFDSDLDPGSVPAAVSIRAADGTAVDAGVHYDADTRTIVAVVGHSGTGPLHLVIGTQLRDVSGQHLAGEYRSTG
ncbi:MAG: hypothetical protein NVSMB29_05770 [Candidatus Dormibacteria bacterium]